jgi:putative copper export protein
MTEELWIAVRWLHVIAMAFFVGGQLMLAAVVVPVMRREPDNQRIRQVARRFGIGTLVALGVLIATGVALADEFFQWENGTLHVKLALVAAVAGLVVLHTRLRDNHLLEGLIFLGSLAIVWLGLQLAH